MAEKSADRGPRGVRRKCDLVSAVEEAKPKKSSLSAPLHPCNPAQPVGSGADGSNPSTTQFELLPICKATLSK